MSSNLLAKNLRYELKILIYAHLILKVNIVFRNDFFNNLVSTLFDLSRRSRLRPLPTRCP